MENMNENTTRDGNGSIVEALLRIMIEEDFNSVVRKPRDYEPSEVIKDALDRMERIMINKRKK